MHDCPSANKLQTFARLSTCDSQSSVTVNTSLAALWMICSKPGKGNDEERETSVGMSSCICSKSKSSASVAMMPAGCSVCIHGKTDDTGIGRTKGNANSVPKSAVHAQISLQKEIKLAPELPDSKKIECKTAWNYCARVPPVPPTEVLGNLWCINSHDKKSIKDSSRSRAIWSLTSDVFLSCANAKLTTFWYCCHINST